MLGHLQWRGPGSHGTEPQLCAQLREQGGPGPGAGAPRRVGEAWQTFRAVPREAVLGVTTALPAATPPAGGPLGRGATGVQTTPVTGPACSPSRNRWRSCARWTGHRPAGGPVGVRLRGRQNLSRQEQLALGLTPGYLPLLVFCTASLVISPSPSPSRHTSLQMCRVSRRGSAGADPAGPVGPVFAVSLSRLCSALETP